MSPVDVARRIADEVLLPRAADVDGGRATPDEGLDAIAEAGLYGLHVPRAAGGLEADPDTAGRVIEELAGGCLTTAFVWLQHQGLVKRLARAGGPLADHWLPLLASGRVRGGVGVGGIRPGGRGLAVTADGDDLVLDGAVPWISGWGMVDVLLVAARAGDEVRWLLLDAPPLADRDTLAAEASSVEVDRIPLAAADGSNSAAVRFAGHRVALDRLVTTQAHDEWQAADAAGLRTNGSLSLGIATRCARLADDARLAATVDDTRRVLDEARVADLPRARALASDLAWHAAQVLLVTAGGAGLAMGAAPQRLAREAMLLQVFGSRPSIRRAHLARLAGRPRR